jgi:hypothetical protein
MNEKTIKRNLIKAKLSENVMTLLLNYLLF